MGKRLIVELTDHQYNNILDFRSINMARAPYKGIIMSAINAIKRGVQVSEDTSEEPKTGYWIPDGYRTEEDWIYGRITYKCPFCGYYDNHRSKYCPDCGAKLKLKKRARSKEVKDD